jgi:hypothetical protein
MPECGIEYVEWLWELRSFKADSMAPITPQDVGVWMGYSGALLCKEDHAILYAMDRAYRAQMPKTTEYHQSRRDKKAG